MTTRLVEAGAAAVARLRPPTWLGVDWMVVGPLELVGADSGVVKSRGTCGKNIGKKRIKTTVRLTVCCCRSVRGS